MAKKSGQPKATKEVARSENEISSEKVSYDFPVVGIGASAGGLEALEQFFENMPDNTGMAFVVIQHLDPKRSGMMTELLQRITKMKVMQATDRLSVKPDHVYVIPPNKNLSLFNGSLHLFDFNASIRLRLPIDSFFRSMAADRNERSIALILSGMGSDGSLGLRDVKERNGIVMVQEPSSARFEGMPQSAIKAVNPDIIAPASELAQKLILFLKNQAFPGIGQVLEEKLLSNIDKILILLREHTGHDFSQYKKTTLYRRIERRKAVNQIDKIADYVYFLQENPFERDLLFKEILIGVTNFFRDLPVWKHLEKELLPDLIKSLPDGYVIRAWVPACSTGEEAYTLAIVFRELIKDTSPRRNISLHIFGTDIDNDAIFIARRGIYSENIVSDIDPLLLDRYFKREDKNFRINSSVREMIIFAEQNIIHDPPFTNLDLLFCRNMLIYMEPVLQRKIFSIFEYCIKPGGILLLGMAETKGQKNEAFVNITGKLKIFRRTSIISTKKYIHMPTGLYRKKSAQEMKPVQTDDNIQLLAEQALIQNFAPASVLINSKGDILYITGHIGKYVEPAAGKANWNIYAMARGELQSLIPGALRKSNLSYKAVVLKKVKINGNANTQLVDVTFQRFEKPEALKDLIMIVFLNSTPSVEEKPVLKTGQQRSTGRIKELEDELQISREELQEAREEMQNSEEELRSINEELQSANEELQSTNEELSSSKEEMQSLNEELQTVNMELQSKVNEYITANSDMNNLLNSTEIATLFLDKDLKIRRFTDQVRTIFKLRDSDIGRPITDLVSNLNYPDMGNIAADVLRTLVSTETAISTTDQKWFNIRILPYRTIDDRIDGLVITFSDISAVKKLEKLQKAANKSLGAKK